jgi:hypothetical protein
VKEGAFTPQEFVEPIREYLLLNAGLAPESLDPTPPAISETVPPIKAVKPRTKWAWISQVMYVASFFAICFLISKGCSIVQQYSERSRADALRSFASQMRLKFEPGDLQIVDPDLSETWLIDHGNANGRALYALEGEVGGLRALLFDYQYKVTHEDRDGDETTRKVIQSVAAFCCANSRLPLFDLQATRS